ncbi:MAG: GAF domain-containing protein [Coleofasciculaceae cyanobacterium]
MTSQLTRFNQAFPGVLGINSLANRLNSSQEQSSPYSKKAQLFADIASRLDPLDLNYIYKKAVEGSREILQADRVVIYSFDANLNGTITAESVVFGYRAAIHDQITDTCLQESKGGLYNNGRVCIINDVTKVNWSDCHLQMLAKYQVKASMTIPIFKNEQLVGLLIAHQCSQTRVWQAKDIDFFVQLAAQITLAFDSGSFLIQRTKAGLASSFSQVALRLRESLEPEQVLNTAVSELRQVLKADRVLICRLSLSYQEATVVAESVGSLWSSMSGLQLSVPQTEEHYINGFAKGYVRPISNLLQGQVLKNTKNTVSEQYQVQSSLVAPIYTGKQLFGLIIVQQCSLTRNWQPPTIDLFRELAVQVGLAFEQANLLKTVETERQRIKLLADFTSTIRRYSNPQDILRSSVGEIRQTLETDRLLIYHFPDSGKSGEITAQSVANGCSEAQEASFNKLLNFDNLEVYKTGRVRLMFDIYQAGLKSSQLKLLKNLQIRASMVAPIMQGEQLVGLLCAHQCSSSRYWQESEFNLLKSLADQIGFALEQTELIEQVKLASCQKNQQNQWLQEQFNNLIKDVERIAEGDLTVRAQAQDLNIDILALFFNMVTESLQRIVIQVKKSTSEVNSSLQENEEAISQLASNAFKQSQETTLTLDSVEQMSQSLKQVVHSAHHAAVVARTATTTAETGSLAMDRTVAKIANLQTTVTETASKVELLGQSSQQISQVVSFINQIALQTNLLALNAGIEAARAGKQGQGFAVVAKQISELADRSAGATKEIEQILKNIQRETEQVVKAMKRGTSEVAEGTRLVEETKQSLGKILEVSHQIDQLVASISQATLSQSETSEVVTELIKEIAKVSQDTSHSSEQISTSLQKTVEIAEQLQASVGLFKVNEV